MARNGSATAPNAAVLLEQRGQHITIKMLRQKLDELLQG